MRVLKQKLFKPGNELVVRFTDAEGIADVSCNGTCVTTVNPQFIRKDDGGLDYELTRQEFVKLLHLNDTAKTRENVQIVDKKAEKMLAREDSGGLSFVIENTAPATKSTQVQCVFPDCGKKLNCLNKNPAIVLRDHTAKYHAWRRKSAYALLSLWCDGGSEIY